MSSIIMTTTTNPIEQHRPMRDSGRYGFVDTRETMDAFARYGWVPVSQQVARVRKAERRGFQRHLVRLENPNFEISLDGVHHSRPQMVIINSHDGTGALRLLWGLIRMACLNGVIAGQNIQSARVLHTPKGISKLPEAVQTMITGFGPFAAQVEQLTRRTLTEAAVRKLVKTCYDARLADVAASGELRAVDYRLPLLRAEDAGNDAFTIFNRVQETVIRGGIKFICERPATDDKPAKAYSQTTRAITAVPTQLRLNQVAYDTVMELV